jgi:DNA-binding MarR family transcriptional regulator|nr:MAG TPA_asm: YjcQ protein [Caudoviricetes sp.]
MKDVTFKILKIMINSSLRSSELSQYTNSIVTIDSLIKRNLIYQHCNNYGEPIDCFSITDSGREYVRQHTEEQHKFIVNFFSQFVSGFLVGVLTTVIAALILNWLTGII